MLYVKWLDSTSPDDDIVIITPLRCHADVFLSTTMTNDVGGHGVWEEWYI